MRDSKQFPKVTVQNPATEQTFTTTLKLYESIYRDKGFNLVSRDNVIPGIGKTKRPADKGPTSELGSAASIAAAIGIDENEKDLTPPAKVDNQPPAGRVAGERSNPTQKELETFGEDLTGSDNAEGSVAAGDDAGKDVIDEGKNGNANNANSFGTVDEGRESKGRNRGRGNK